MKNKMNLIWVGVGLVPYVITLVYSIVVMFLGTSSCVVTASSKSCQTLFGLNAFGHVWFVWLYLLFPLFLSCLLFIILGLSGKRMTYIKKNKLLIVFGVSPFALAIAMVLFRCLSYPVNDIGLLFMNIFIYHYFVAFADFIGIFLILLGLSGLQKLDKKKKDK